MAKSFRIGSRTIALTSVGLAMFVGFTGLGLGWSWLDSMASGFGPSAQLKTSASTGSDASETSEETELVTEEFDSAQIIEPLTPEQEEQSNLKLLARTHTIDALEFLEEGKYWKAIHESQKAIKLDPQDFEAYGVRDEAYKKLGIRRKKRELMIQGVICDIQTGAPINAGMTKQERRELLSRETDLFGMRGITDRPLPGF